MWHLTLQEKRAFEQAHVLSIPETDQEWESDLANAMEEGIDLLAERKEDLDDVRGRLLASIPERFYPYVLDGTFNTPQLPQTVREDYINWVNEQTSVFEAVLDAAHESKQGALPYLSHGAREVYEQSLHDAQIVGIKRLNNQLTLHLDTKGGFSTKSVVILSFTGIISEIGSIEVGQYYIYDEIIKTDAGIALRVIFDCPEVEWTIEAKDLDAMFYYPPKTYYDFSGTEDFAGYAASLNIEHPHFLITPNIQSRIVDIREDAPYLVLESGTLEQRVDGIYIGEELIAESFDRCISFVHTSIYEDPYAYFSEPVPMDELEAAALSEILELQVRAWNTMYANPQGCKTIINRVLMRLRPTEDNEMMLYVYVRHFEKEGVLKEETRTKYWDIINES
ncbi:DUF4085 family protein [Lysinibacillus sp. 54212]|uniref:DUF4085 family protein n=1 Tax=Lysinibacillus sp. 54212 TaxID=3119829 RepID=UPI002FC83B36